MSMISVEQVIQALTQVDRMAADCKSHIEQCRGGALGIAGGAAGECGASYALAGAAGSLADAAASLSVLQTDIQNLIVQLAR